VFNNFKIILLVIFICQFLTGQKKDNSGTTIDQSVLSQKTCTAVRTSSPPKIDGYLNDAQWGNAVPITDFLQIEPDNLAGSTELSEVRILYDDENMYVGCRMYDSEPGKIVARLARRDDWMSGGDNNADWFFIAFDSNNDDKTGYGMGVNAAGVKFDITFSNDTNIDGSWDGVWDAEVNISDEGWTAELRFPFSLFNFESNGNHPWGLGMSRGIQRYQEYSGWPGRKRGVQGEISLYGILKGIENVPSPKKLEFLPYSLGGNQFGDETGLTSDLGLDVRYGLSSNATLNITVNPDFGQVEADPSVLNLTAFETFYGERRPFFVEGSSFFTNQLQLFHSRRIGHEPGFYHSDIASELEKPETTTILAAAKLLGETDGGLKYGIIESVTDEEYGIWEYSTDEIASVDSLFEDNVFTGLDTSYATEKENLLIEPYTNYFIGRIEKPVFNRHSTVGIIVTDVLRNGSTRASAGGLDWRLKFLENRVVVAGQYAVSQVGDIRGNGGRLYVEYNDPLWWDLSILGTWFDDQFEINDLGYLRRNGNWTFGSFGGIRKQDPWGIFLRNDLRFNYFRNVRNDGLVLSNNLELNQRNTMKNYWSFGFGGNVGFPHFDDSDTFKDSSAWEISTPFRWGWWAWISTDNRKRIVLNPVYGMGNNELGGWGYMAKLEVTVKPTNTINMSIELTQNYSDNRTEWVGVESDTNIVYSSAKQRMNDFRFRLDWTFTPDLSLQMFVQPFNVNMDYYSFKRLRAPKTLDFEPYDYSGDPDFKIDNTVGTFVLRWEYSPGRALFVVYNLGDSNYFSSEDNEWYPAISKALFIKLNYWLQI
tara:strand:- start:7933 stop:10392 length:2460 start_codon:yes stop_codon:yes gene_type:complete